MMTRRSPAFFVRPDKSAVLRLPETTGCSHGRTRPFATVGIVGKVMAVLSRRHHGPPPAGAPPLGQTAMGVTANTSDVRVKVLVDTHACEAVRAHVAFTEPALDAVQNERCDRVSDVPPFVHGPALPVIDFEPPVAAAIVACFLDVSPAAAAVAPAAPGSAVWSFSQQVAVEKVP